MASPAFSDPVPTAAPDRPADRPPSSRPVSPPPYRHPGQAFLGTQPRSAPAALDFASQPPSHTLNPTPGHTPSQTPTKPDLEAAVLAYSQFLRQSAGVGDAAPISLGPIYQHFGIPEPRRAPLRDQQGILVNGDRGLILIKEDDPWVRQRFTEGHELMELLFDGLAWQGTIDPDQKERLCDRGAAHLLMPLSSFLPQLHRYGPSLATARILAQRYQTSLLATLIHLVRHSSQPQALILWHPAHSHRDRHKKTSTGHPAPAKIRVRWQVTSPGWQGGYIPRNKSLASVAPQSIVAHSHRDRQPAQGTALFHFGAQPCPCQVETLPLQIQGKNGILSLLTH